MTQPGPTADRITELEREIARLENMSWSSPKDRRSERWMAARDELSRLRNEQPKGGDEILTVRATEEQSAYVRALPRYATDEEVAADSSLIRTSPSPSPGPQDVRVTDAMVEAAAMKQYDLDCENQEAIPTWEYIGRIYRMHARECLEAALAQSDAQPVGWRDMKSAPKDGTPILSKIASGALFVVRWRSDSTYSNQWMTDSGAQGAALYVRPTEWMPLYTTPPSLPEGAREALEKAVDLFLEARMKNEPGDSRAVADDLVALAAVRCGANVEDSLECLRKCAAEPPRPKPEIAATPTPSSAGLIEAAEASDAVATDIVAAFRRCDGNSKRCFAEIEGASQCYCKIQALKALARLRARAADRSAT